ncbi:hypothetical protein CR513_49760, partial [Mucuna pruriens]
MAPGSNNTVTSTQDKWKSGKNTLVGSGSRPKEKSEAGIDTIWIIMDCMNYYAHFVALSNLYTAATMAQQFMDQIYRLHGALVEIITRSSWKLWGLNRIYLPLKFKTLEGKGPLSGSLFLSFFLCLSISFSFPSKSYITLNGARWDLQGWMPKAHIELKINVVSKFKGRLAKKRRTYDLVPEVQGSSKLGHVPSRSKSSSNLDLNPKHTTICRNMTTSAAPLSDSPPHAHLLSVTPDFAVLLRRNSSTASTTSRAGSTASAIAAAISARSDADSFRFDTTNRTSAAASIFRDRDFSVAESSGSAGAAARSSASAASLCSSMRAAAADSRAGMEASRWRRDSRVSSERDWRDWSLESRDWDLSATERWSEEKWAERVVKRLVHVARMLFLASSSSKNCWILSEGVPIRVAIVTLMKPNSKTLINLSEEQF